MSHQVCRILICFIYSLPERPQYTRDHCRIYLTTILLTYIIPDEVSYNSALHAMTKEGDTKWVRCAEDMFQEMKDKNIPISQITYHVLMNIYSKSKDPDGARKAEELLRRMEKEDFSLNDFSYNICIDGYARRGDHRRSESLLEEMISLTERGNLTCQPTIHSFASVVRFLSAHTARPTKR